MSDPFSYSEEYQVKILSYMLSDSQFCTIAKSYLDETQFANKSLQWYFKALSDPEKFHTPVTLQEDLLRAVKGKQIREEEIDKYVSVYSLMKVPPLPAEKEHISNTLDTFIRTQEVKKVLMNSFDLMENEQWEEIADQMAKAIQSGAAVKDNGQFYFKELKERLLRRINNAESSKIPTGIPELDLLLNGGLHNKQLGLVAGGTGRGKSVFLQWLAKTAVFLGKKVVYFTLEMPADSIAARFDSALAQVKMSDLNVYNKEVFERLSQYSESYGDRLVIKEYEADAATVGTLKAFVTQLTAQGFIPDLIIVDYLDLIKPHRRYKDQTQELDAITKALHGMAKGLDCHMWTATQLNRGGIVMENPDETSIAGALSKLFTVDVALFLAQTPNERLDEIMRIILIKSRNGLVGRTVKITTDFSYMIFYRGTGETIDDDEADS